MQAQFCFLLVCGAGKNVQCVDICGQFNSTALAHQASGTRKRQRILGDSENRNRFRSAKVRLVNALTTNKQAKWNKYDD